jgi:p-aminobenzoyl-glutamate transporter AbgT
VWYLYVLAAMVALIVCGLGMGVLERVGVIGSRWRSLFRRIGDLLAAILDAP